MRSVYHFLMSSYKLNDTQFRSLYGVGAAHCEILWMHISTQQPYHTLKPKYLLWGLMFLKVYSTEEVHGRLCNVTRTSFRTWSWESIIALANLKIVRYKFIR